MRFRSLNLLLIVALTGCNLFGATEPNPVDAGGAVGDGGTSGADVSGPSDVRPPGVDGCLPPTDAELCSLHGVECGELLVRSEDGVIERQAAVDVAGDGSSCGESGGFLTGCNSGSGPDLTFDAPQEGQYIVRVHLWASQADSGTILSRVRVTNDGEVVREIPVFATEEDPGTFEVLVPLTAGSHVFTWRLSNDYYDSSIPEDRNLYFDWVEVEGPMVQPVDECGLSRGGVQCGECSGTDACGFAQVGICACSCRNMDGSCAAEGPQSGNPCAECVVGEGWRLVDGSCDDGDGCTNDSCDDRRAVCENEPKGCGGDACEGGTCVDGTCEFTPLPDDSNCGNGGICTAGLCACPDGTDQERQCADAVDGDCDGFTDCDDSDCEGRNCGPGGVTCQMGECQ